MRHSPCQYISIGVGTVEEEITAAREKALAIINRLLTEDFSVQLVLVSSDPDHLNSVHVTSVGFIGITQIRYFDFSISFHLVYKTFVPADYKLPANLSRVQCRRFFACIAIDLLVSLAQKWPTIKRKHKV